MHMIKMQKVCLPFSFAGIRIVLPEVSLHCVSNLPLQLRMIPLHTATLSNCDEIELKLAAFVKLLHLKSVKSTRTVCLNDSWQDQIKAVFCFQVSKSLRNPYSYNWSLGLASFRSG